MCLEFTPEYLCIGVLYPSTSNTVFKTDSTTEAAPAVLKWSGQEVGGAMSSGGCG